MKLAVISLGGQSSKSIAEESRSYFSSVSELSIRSIEVHTTLNGSQVLCDAEPLPPFDCVYVRGSYKYALLQQAISEVLYKKTYLPLHPSSFPLGHNKFLTLLELQKYNVPVPASYFAGNIKSARKVLESAHYPIIMKLSTGTQGVGVMMADSVSSARSILDTLEVFNQPYLIQEYIETNATDIRIIVAGDKVVAAMKRKAAHSEIRANIHQGGVGVAFTPSSDIEEIAIKAAAAIKADVCAVDILESGKKTYVIELNLSPGLEGISKATKANVAKEIASYLFLQTKAYKAHKISQDYNKFLSGIDNGNHTSQIVSHVDLKAGILRIPERISKLSGFRSDEEVIYSVGKKKLVISKT